MRISRIYCPNSLQINGEVILEANASNHILHVLRLRLGDTIVLFNGQGGEYKAELFAIQKQYAVLRIQEFNDREAESSIKIYLGQ